MAKKKASAVKKILIVMFLIFIATIGSIGYKAYNMVYKPNVILESSKTKYIYIHTGDDIKDVTNILYQNNYIINRSSFEWMAQMRKYTNNVKPGRYELKSGMSNFELVNTLNRGLQSPVRVSFNNVRTIQELAGKIGKQLEADSLSIIRILSNNLHLKKYGFSVETVPAMFIPNTYEFYWNTSAEQFVKRMFQEYNKYWDKEKLAKAKSIGLTPVEVAIVASIVQQETNMSDEKSRVAGVYINRVNKGWPLQADPTLKFAWGDFTIKRLWDKHKAIDSPYNTYKYAGLPPGPICLPSVVTLNAVLNYEHHDYMFFCAKSDFSGYHVFAKTNAQHERNAQAYRRALSQRNIY